MGNTIIIVFVCFIIILVHEAGHFLMAKLLGLPVISFSIGFGKAIWRKRIGNSVYALRILPFGGSVRQVAIDDEVCDFKKLQRERSKLLSALFPLEDEEVALATELSALPHKERGRLASLLNLLVVMAGPVANLALATLICAAHTIGYGKGDKFSSLNIYWVAEQGPAKTAGIRVGDKIVETNGIPVSSNSGYLELLGRHVTKPISYTVQRNDNASLSTFNVTFGAERREIEGGGTFPDPGFRYKVPPVAFSDVLMAINNSIIVPIRQWFVILPTLPDEMIKAKNVKGPVSFVSYLSQSVNNGLMEIVSIAIMLNLLVVLVNVLPIPPTDGWVILILLSEMIYGRPVAANYQRVVANVMMSFFLVLTLFLIGKDVVSLATFF